MPYTNISPGSSSSLEQLWALHKKKHSGMVMHDGQQILECNESFAALLGYAREELLEQMLLKVIPPSWQPGMADLWEQYGEGPSEAMALKRDGIRLPVLIETVRMNHQGREVYLSEFLDVSRLSQAEESAMRSQAYYKVIFEQVAEALFIHDIEGRILDVNQRACNNLGYTREKLLMMEVTDFEVDIDQKKARQEWEKMVPGKPYKLYGHHRRMDGSLFPVELSVGSTLWQEGKIFVVLANDITERHHAEELLHQSEEKFRMIVEGSPDPIFIQSQGLFTYLNPSALRLFGVLVAHKIVGRPVRDYIQPDSRAAYEQMAREVEGDHVRGYHELLEHQILTPQGEKWVDTNGVSLVFEGRKSALFFMRDITYRKQAEQELNQTRTILDSATKAMTDALFIVDPEGRLLHLNDAFARLHGFESIKECPRHIQDYQQLLDVFLPDGQPAPPEVWVLPRALKGETGIDEEFHLRRKDTGKSWIGSFSFAPIPKEDGGIAGVVVVARDITAQREQENLLHLVIDNLPVGIIIASKEGKIVRVNREADLIWGTAPHLDKTQFGEYKGWWPHNGQRLKSEEWAIFRALEKGEASFREEIHIESFEGTPKTILNTALPIHDSHQQITGALVVIEDITYRKKAEEAIRQSALDKASARFKQQFLTNMSHEIRTPLTGVMGMISMLQKTDPSPLQKEYISILKSSGENLKEIINQILDLSRIEAGKVSLDYQRFRFATLLDDARKLFQGLQKDQVAFKVRLDPAIPEFVEADLRRITQVINNLVLNAIKFTDKGEICLGATLQVLDPSDNTLRIRINVRDTGKGIPPEKQKNLFNPFYQAGTHENSREGTGLGLAISKELVKLHGGEIGVDSQPGSYSDFWFTITARQVRGQEQKKKAPPATGKPSTKLRILLVEDNRVNQKVFQIILNFLGHTVTFANNGQQALEVFYPEAFDLILMDINMPVMDGITATRTLRERYSQLPPIVGLSANAAEGDREKYMQQGLDQYLTKPLEEKDFNQLVNELFAVKKEKKEMSR